MSTITTTPNPSAIADPVYWLGRESLETQRLIQQARFIDPFTRTVLAGAGITPGMSVLDIGCGAGNVSAILGELVGPGGHVTAIDLNPDILETARAQVQAHRLGNVTFLSGDCRTMQFDRQFDAVVGRLVLLYVRDPVEAVRSLASHVKPGGIVVFQEYNLHAEAMVCWPPTPLFDDCRRWIVSAAAQAGINTTIGYALHGMFTAAGLPEPQMQLDAGIGGGPTWDGYAYAANSVRSMLPLILASGADTEEEIGIDTLADRLRDAACAAGAVIKLPDLVSAWVQVP